MEQLPRARSFWRFSFVDLNTYPFNENVQYVIPAGIAGIHDCMDAGGRATQEQLPRSQGWQGSDHIHVSWIPAVHAGMTCYLNKVKVVSFVDFVFFVVKIPK